MNQKLTTTSKPKKKNPSRAKHLKSWRLKNSSKTTQQKKKDNYKYYLKNYKKITAKARIEYHKNAMREWYPVRDFEDNYVWENNFDSYISRRFFWVNARNTGTLTLTELRENIEYVIKLQNHKLIPSFLFDHAETMKIKNELSDDYTNMPYSNLRYDDEENEKQWKLFWKKRDKKFIKMVNANYENHIKKNKILNKTK